jgi:hypothetical protein
MKREPRKLKLSKETLRSLTEGTLLYIKGGISGEPREGCGGSNGWDCPSNPLQNACNTEDVSVCLMTCLDC